MRCIERFCLQLLNSYTNCFETENFEMHATVTGSFCDRAKLNSAAIAKRNGPSTGVSILTLLRI